VNARSILLVVLELVTERHVARLGITVDNGLSNAVLLSMKYLRFGIIAYQALQRNRKSK